MEWVIPKAKNSISNNNNSKYITVPRRTVGYLSDLVKLGLLLILVIHRIL